jgi:inner membrane transporter RhtA
MPEPGSLSRAPASPRVPAPLYALGAIASVQVGATFARQLFAFVGPSGAVFLRVALGALILLAIRRPGRSRLSGTQWQSVIIFGLVIAGMNLCFYQAIARIPLGVAVTIEFLGPLGVAIAGSRKPLDFAWAALAAAGVAILSFKGGGSVSAVGLAFALAAAVGWACYILISQRVGRIVPGPNGLALALAIAGVALLPFGVASAGARLLLPHNLLAGTLVAVLSTAIPFSLEFAALRRLSSQVFGVLMSLEPAMGAAAGFIFLAQRLAPQDLVGIVLVMVASVAATLTASRQTAVSTLP